MAFFAATIGRDTIEITAAPAIPDWIEPGPHHVKSIPLDPSNKSKEDYTKLLIADGWRLIGEWRWVGRALQVEVERA